MSLGAGEVRTVQIGIDVTRALSHWDAGGGTWALEPTEYVLQAGRSSRDLPLHATLRID